MFFKSLAKPLLIAGVSLFLAACQTTGLKPGSIQSNFPPSGWIKSTKGNTTIYVCKPSVCKSPQLVVVTPAQIKGNVESIIRANILSAGLIKEIGNSAARASSGAYKTLSVKRVTTNTYSGFDTLVRLQARGKKPLYIADRTVVQQDRGTSITSISYSANTSKSNLRRYLANTTIRRVQ